MRSMRSFGVLAGMCDGLGRGRRCGASGVLEPGICGEVDSSNDVLRSVGQNGRPQPDGGQSHAVLRPQRSYDLHQSDSRQQVDRLGSQWP